MSQSLLWDDVRPGASNTPLLCEGLPGVHGELLAQPEDFEVEELLPYEPTGEGSHYFVQVRKRALSTVDAASLLSGAARISAREIGFAGRKDVQAVATQWFSLPVPPVTPSSDLLEILQVSRHPKKLKNGHVRANRFKIRIRNVHPDAETRLVALLDKLANGHPNYFGCQRFGRDGKNLVNVLRWLNRGCPRIKNARFLVSALQSAIFNAWLGERLRLEGLERAVAGDVLKKRATGGLFQCDEVAVDSHRLLEGELDVCGPLFGPKMKPALHIADDREAAWVARLALSESSRKVLAKFGAGGRRPSRVCATDLSYERQGNHLDFRFTLPSGAYATVFLAEIMQPESGWVERRHVAAALTRSTH